MWSLLKEYNRRQSLARYTFCCVKQGTKIKQHWIIWHALTLFGVFSRVLAHLTGNILKWLKIMQCIVSTRPGTIKYRSHLQWSLHVISIEVALGNRQCRMNEMMNNPGPSESLCTNPNKDYHWVCLVPFLEVRLSTVMELAWDFHAESQTYIKEENQKQNKTDLFKCRGQGAELFLFGLQKPRWPLVPAGM